MAFLSAQTLAAPRKAVARQASPRRPRTVCQSAPPSRRDVLRLLATVPVSAAAALYLHRPPPPSPTGSVSASSSASTTTSSLSFLSPPPARAEAPSSSSAALSKQQLAQSGAVVQCARVLGPVPRYIDAGAWDKGRTSVNYCTRVLALRRNMKAVAERLEGDAFYDGLGLMDDVANAMTQLDASLYTPLFIPADDGEITVEQRRYQTQASEFFQLARDGLKQFIALLPADELEAANKVADAAKYEIELEFE